MSLRAACLALAAVVTMVELAACSGGSGGPQVTGTVATLVPAFCVQQSGSTTCFVTAHASGVKQGDLKIGECVRVGYRTADADGTTKTASSIERANHC
jgi:hypothetical protein